MYLRDALRYFTFKFYFKSDLEDLTGLPYLNGIAQAELAARREASQASPKEVYEASETSKTPPSPDSPSSPKARKTARHEVEAIHENSTVRIDDRVRPVKRPHERTKKSDGRSSNRKDGPTIVLDDHATVVNFAKPKKELIR